MLVTIITKNKEKQMRAIVTVIGQDRTGIVAGVSTRLTELDINIIDISQTIMDGFFTMNMVVEIDEAKRFGEVKDNLEKLGELLKVDIKIMNEAIFEAMHQV
jgi:ACT domain-containing protein